MPTKNMQAFIDANNAHKIIFGEARTPADGEVVSAEDVKSSDRVRYKLSNGESFLITAQDKASSNHRPVWDI